MRRRARVGEVEEESLRVLEVMAYWCRDQCAKAKAWAWETGVSFPGAPWIPGYPALRPSLVGRSLPLYHLTGLVWAAQRSALLGRGRGVVGRGAGLEGRRTWDVGRGRTVGDRSIGHKRARVNAHGSTKESGERRLGWAALGWVPCDGFRFGLGRVVSC